MSRASKKGRNYTVQVGERTHSVELLSRKSNSVAFRLEGKDYEVAIHPEALTVQASATRTVSSSLAGTTTNGAHSNTPNVHAPMPGLVVSISIEVGAEVKSGDPALVLEAMKMENSVAFTKSGKVSAIHVKAGDQVEAGQVLIELT